MKKNDKISSSIRDEKTEKKDGLNSNEIGFSEDKNADQFDNLAKEARNKKAVSEMGARNNCVENEHSVVEQNLKESRFYELLEKTARRKTVKKNEENMDLNEKKTIDAYRAVLRDLSQLEKENYEIFMRCLLSIYVDKKEWRKVIKEILSDRRVKEGIDKYNGCWGECFSLLQDINKVFGKDVSKITTYSFAPNAYLYGCITKGDKSIKYTDEASNEKILNIVNALLDLDEDIFLDWVYAILGFDQDFVQVIDERKAEVVKERKKLVKRIKSLITENEKAASAITNSLFKKGYLDRLLTFSNTSVKDAEIKQKMQEKIDDLTKIVEIGEEGRRRQKELIDERDASIAELNRKVRQFEKLSDELVLRLKELDDKNQIIELLKADLEANRKELVKQSSEYQEKEIALQNENDTFRRELEAISADLALKNNELERYRENGDRMEVKAKQDQAKILIQNLAEQLNYLTLFYQELKETGSLDADSIDMYRDVILDISKGFERIGVVRIGDIGNSVTFDSGLYSSMTGPMANGEKATVTGYGWMINGEVVVKATVERED